MVNQLGEGPACHQHFEWPVDITSAWELSERAERSGAFGQFARRDVRSAFRDYLLCGFLSKKGGAVAATVATRRRSCAILVRPRASTAGVPLPSAQCTPPSSFAAAAPAAYLPLCHNRRQMDVSTRPRLFCRHVRPPSMRAPADHRRSLTARRKISP